MKLHETTEDALAEARVDPETGMIYGLKICGRHSRNGRRYPPPVFQESRDLYEGKPLKKDGHGKKGEVPGFEETIGILRNVKVKQDGLYADVDVVDEGADGRKFLNLAQRASEVFGASQEASGQVVRGSRGEPDTVKSINDVRGIALVANPASTEGLFESDVAAAELLESLASAEDGGRDQHLRELELRDAAREAFGEKFLEPEQADSIIRRAAKFGVTPKEFVEDWQAVLDAPGGISASSSERDPDNLFPGPRDQFSSNGDHQDPRGGYGDGNIFGEDGPDPRDLFS